VPLTDVKVKNAKPREKPHKLSDERGLYLLVTPAGGKWWRFDYRFAGRRKTLSLGTYPDVSLQKARKKREAAREQVAAGTDPSQVRKAEKLAQASAESFEAIALEWHARCSPNWSDKYATKVLARLKANVFPWVGKKAAMDIEPPELLAVLRRMESRGAVDTARRVRMHCGQVFRYAIATGRAQRDPAADLKGAIVPPRVIHFPTITDPRAVGRSWRAIDESSGHFATKCALRLHLSNGGYCAPAAGWADLARDGFQAALVRRFDTSASSGRAARRPAATETSCAAPREFLLRDRPQSGLA